MLELLSGRKSFDSSRPRSEQFLIRWATLQFHDIDALAKMVDPALNGLYPVKSLSRFTDVICSVCPVVLVGAGTEQKTKFASYFLKGEANYWWESTRALEGEIKFLNLTQGDLTVAEYEAKFTELARFVPDQVDTDEKKARRFE
ncbi:hypothetical protein AgCh_005288 [Apium graveolens]